MPTVNRNYTRNFLANVLLRVDFEKISTWEEENNTENLKLKYSSLLPNYKHITGQEVDVQLGPDQDPSMHVHPHSAHEFVSTNGVERIFLAETTFLYEVTKYDNFTNFYRKFETYLDIFLTQYTFQVTNRLGLRYVNQIVLPEGPTFDFKGYLNKSLYNESLSYIRTLGGSPLRIMNMIEVDKEDGILRTIYGIPNTQYPNPIAKKEFLIDFDFYTNDHLTKDTIKSRTKLYNDVVTNQFEESIGPKLRKLMK